MELLEASPEQTSSGLRIKRAFYINRMRNVYKTKKKTSHLLAISTIISSNICALSYYIYLARQVFLYHRQVRKQNWMQGKWRTYLYFESIWMEPMLMSHARPWNAILVSCHFTCGCLSRRIVEFRSKLFLMWPCERERRKKGKKMLENVETQRSLNKWILWFAAFKATYSLICMPLWLSHILASALALLLRQTLFFLA